MPVLVSDKKPLKIFATFHIQLLFYVVESDTILKIAVHYNIPSIKMNWIHNFKKHRLQFS